MRTELRPRQTGPRAPAAALAALALGALLGLGACPGTLEDKERFFTDGGATTGDGGDCGDVPARILQPACGGTGCHGARAPQQGLDLESPGVAQRVLSVRSTGCMGVLADPQAPESSVLYSKLLDTPSCGSRMPLARPPLSAADTECVRAWIRSLGGAADGGR